MLEVELKKKTGMSGVEKILVLVLEVFWVQKGH